MRKTVCTAASLPEPGSLQSWPWHCKTDLAVPPCAAAVVSSKELGRLNPPKTAVITGGSPPAPAVNKNVEGALTLGGGV